MLHQKVQQLPRILAKETIKLVVNLNRVKGKRNNQPQPFLEFCLAHLMQM